LNPSAATFQADLMARIKAKDTIFYLPYDPTFSVAIDALGNLNGFNAGAPNASGITEALTAVYAMLVKGLIKPAYNTSGNILNWTSPLNYGYFPINFHHNYDFTAGLDITIVLVGFPTAAFLPVIG
jgi:hypothetical protein